MFKDIVSPLLDHLDSEKMHVMARDALHLAETNPTTLKLLKFLFAYQRSRFSSSKLFTEVGGVKMDNPGMLGAGWDKTGEAVLAWYILGAGAISVGSVLEKYQYGNDKVRQFIKRTPDGRI